MTVEELCAYAKEQGLPQKKIDMLLAELHPNENGELSPQESLEATMTVNYIVDLRENTRMLLEEGKAFRNKHGKTKTK